MKTNSLLIVLSIAVAILGIWVAKINTALMQKDTEIAALNQKIEAVQHGAVAALTQSNRSVAMVSTATATGGGGAPKLGKNQIAANPKAAIEAAMAMPPGPDRDGALMDALVAYAVVDPQAAWDAAQDFPADAGAGKTTLLKDIIKAWAAKDPAQAAAKYASLGVTETSGNANNTVGTIEADWLKVDPEAASKWVETLPVGGTRDSAIRALVPIATQSDPPTAFRWADTLADPSYRGTLMNGVVTAWAKLDPDAALAAVKSRPDKHNGRMEALTALVVSNAPKGWVPPAGAVPGQ